MTHEEALDEIGRTIRAGLELDDAGRARRAKRAACPIHSIRSLGGGEHQCSNCGWELSSAEFAAYMEGQKHALGGRL